MPPTDEQEPQGSETHRAVHVRKEGAICLREAPLLFEEVAITLQEVRLLFEEVAITLQEVSADRAGSE